MSTPSRPDWGDDPDDETMQAAQGEDDTGMKVAPVSAEETEEVAGTVFPDFHTWVGEWLVPVVRRPFKAGSVWCPQWWLHPEALRRLDALWRAWESSRAEGGAGMSYWWVMHFDSHFAVLTDGARGPFAACKDEVHDPKIQPLPCDTPPGDWSWPQDI